MATVSTSNPKEKNEKPYSNLNLKTILQIPIVRQLIFILGIAAGVTLGIFLYLSIQEPIYRPLDYHVTSQNMASIIDTFEKAGIRYKISETDNSVILIPAKDIQLARVKLSAAGVPKDDGFSYSFLNDQNSIGSSQFLENARYLRALENDLSKTISALDGIASARVHIAMPQTNVFADEKGKPTASVVLTMSPGMQSEKEKIRAIMQIIASSVPGLDPKNVAITDQYGHYLSSALDENSIYNTEQLSYQNNIQNYYEKRIETIIIPLLGENKVNVRVLADIDFSQQEEANEQYDPKQSVLRSEQSVVEQSGAAAGASGPPGSLSNTPPETDSESQGGSGGQGQGNNQQNSSSQGRNQSIKNYELGKSVTYKKSNFAKIRNLSVAVVVDNELILDPKTKKYMSKPLDKDKLEKITNLVKATIGYDSKRGDTVTVVNSSFNLPKQADIIIKDPPLWDQPWFWDLVRKVLGGIFGFVILYLLYKRLASYLKSSNHSVPIHHIPKIMEEVEDENADQEAIQLLQQTRQQKIGRLKELATKEPSQVASVIKNWVGK